MRLRAKKRLLRGARGALQAMGLLNVRLERTLALLVAPELEGWRLGPSSLRERLRLWRQGFLGVFAAHYEHIRAHPEWYVSDAERALGTWRINGPNRFLLEDKLAFAMVFGRFSPRIAPVDGCIVEGRFVPLPPADRGPTPAREWLSGAKETLFLKPLRGSRGQGIHRYELREGEPVLDGRPVSWSELEACLGGRSWVVAPRIEQRGASHEIFPGSLNTIRVLTMWDPEADPETDEPFVAAAIHRFGSAASGCVDNLCAGGVCAAMDVETGVMGPAVAHPTSDGLVRHAAHPDTGRPIEGVAVPGWPAIRDELLAIARRVAFVPYVGWDVAPTENGDGFVIVEGNSDPDLESVQLHQPLLADARVRRFYAKHGVLRR